MAAAEFLRPVPIQSCMVPHQEVRRWFMEKEKKKEKDCQESAGLRSNSGLGDCQVSTQASRGSNDDD